MEELKMFDIVYADLSDGRIGSEQSGIHPYVIIQNNIGNKHCPTILGMSLTSSLKKEYMPTHCIIQKTKENGLKHDSMLLGETLTQIDKVRINSKIGSITDVNIQNEILGVFLANVTGKKHYAPVWMKVINAIFGLMREGGYAKSA